MSTGHVGSATANSSALVEEASMANRQGKAVWAHDVGTAFKEAGGPGEVARLLSGGLPDFFT